MRYLLPARSPLCPAAPALTCSPARRKDCCLQVQGCPYCGWRLPASRSSGVTGWDYGTRFGTSLWAVLRAMQLGDALSPHDVAASFAEIIVGLTPGGSTSPRQVCRAGLAAVCTSSSPAQITASQSSLPQIHAICHLNLRRAGSRMRRWYAYHPLQRVEGPEPSCGWRCEGWPQS